MSIIKRMNLISFRFRAYLLILTLSQKFKLLEGKVTAEYASDINNLINCQGCLTFQEKLLNKTDVK